VCRLKAPAWQDIEEIPSSKSQIAEDMDWNVTIQEVAIARQISFEEATIHHNPPKKRKKKVTIELVLKTQPAIVARDQEIKQGQLFRSVKPYLL
jgi:hypothetical protein